MNLFEIKNIEDYRNSVTRDVMVKERRGKFHIFVIDTNVNLRKARTYGLIKFEDGTLEWVYKTQVKFVIPS